jgi:hypothetical protein
LDDLSGFGEVGRRPLLGAGLNDALVFASRFGNGAALADVMRERLLNVHVLAGFACENGGAGVPVIGGRDQHRIDIAQFEKLAEVLKRAGIGTSPLARRLGEGLVDIGGGDELRARSLAHVARNVAPASSASDQADSYAVIRADHSGGGEGGSKEDTPFHWHSSYQSRSIAREPGGSC